MPRGPNGGWRPNSPAQAAVLTMKVAAGEMDVAVRILSAQRIQCDETWSFCYAKRKNAEPVQYDRAGDGVDVDRDRPRYQVPSLVVCRRSRQSNGLRLS